MNIELLKVQDILDNQNLAKVECEACIETFIDPGKMCIRDFDVLIINNKPQYDYYCLGCGQSYVESKLQNIEDDLYDLGCILSDIEEYKEKIKGE